MGALQRVVDEYHLHEMSQKRPNQIIGCHESDL